MDLRKFQWRQSGRRERHPLPCPALRAGRRAALGQQPRRRLADPGRVTSDDDRAAGEKPREPEPRYGQGAWIDWDWPGRLFTRNQAITAMVLAERLAAGYGDDDPFVIG